MIKLHTFHLWESPQAGMYQQLMANEGIACLLRNDRLSAALGEIPFTECFPELWVIDDETYPRAKLLLAAWLDTESSVDPEWICTFCGEASAGHFSCCWSCGKEQQTS